MVGISTLGGLHCLLLSAVCLLLPAILLNHRSPGNETPDDCDDGEYQKKVNETAPDMQHHEAEQPEDEEYNRDRPEHGGLHDKVLK